MAYPMKASVVTPTMTSPAVTPRVVTKVPYGTTPPVSVFRSVSVPQGGSVRAPASVGMPIGSVRAPVYSTALPTRMSSLTVAPASAPVSPRVLTVSAPSAAPLAAPAAVPTVVPEMPTVSAVVAEGPKVPAFVSEGPKVEKASVAVPQDKTLQPTSIMPVFECPSKTIHEEPFSQGMLSIVVLGASGDLAKKKTYPSLMDLYINGFLPPWTTIVGYARSAAKPEEFRAKLRPWLLKVQSNEAQVDSFLSRCTYFKGAYDSQEDFAKLNQTLDELETVDPSIAQNVIPGFVNRLFYFAIPPDAFLSSAVGIRASAMTDKGFTRLIVEKPFGHDYNSALQLISDLGALFTEDYIYRIDHYLAKELVQNLYMFRFGNTFLEPTFNHNYISSVQITFKEPFGTEGRGGYFTNYGIIRDVIQNHLMQVLSIVAMEPPPRIQGEDAGSFIRDAKNNVLRCIAPVNLDEVVIGQYIGADGKPGYLEDDSIKDREKAKYVPTFAAVVLHINNPRWAGVPFVLKAGKALNERKVDVRIQYKEAPAGKHMFDGQHCARNELVMRLQPDEAVYMKINVKEPGLATKPIQSEMDLSYKARYQDVYNPDAYTRLILEALRGNQANFVRSDELLNSWKIFDPLLVALEQTEKRLPVPYRYGSRGPAEADQLLAVAGGFKFDGGYVWQSPTLREEVASKKEQ